MWGEWPLPRSSLSAGGDALLVSLVCRSVLHHFHFKGCVHSVSFSPDGRYGLCAQDGPFCGGLALARVDLVGSLWEPVPGPGVGRPDSNGSESRLLQGAPGAAPPSATPGLAWLTAGVMASR